MHSVFPKTICRKIEKQPEEKPKKITYAIFIWLKAQAVISSVKFSVGHCTLLFICIGTNMHIKKMNILCFDV